MLAVAKARVRWSVGMGWSRGLGHPLHPRNFGPVTPQTSNYFTKAAPRDLGLHGVRMITSDDHAGLKAALYMQVGRGLDPSSGG